MSCPEAPAAWKRLSPVELPRRDILHRVELPDAVSVVQASDFP